MGLSPSPLQININGEAGTSKSHLITVLSTTLYNMARANGKPIPLARAAPIRVATFNINGKTIYNLLRLPVNRPFNKLPTTSLIPL